jgi:hypothetical protein
MEESMDHAAFEAYMGLRARCFGDMMINSGSSGNDEA